MSAIKPQEDGPSAQASNSTSKTGSNTSVFNPNLSLPPPKIVHTQGNYLTTESGHKIFDASGGPAVASIGHNNPRIRNAIISQLDSVGFVYSPFFATQVNEDLATFLTNSTNGQFTKVFVVSSGAEAVEAAMKLARQYFVEKGETQRVKFIGRYQSYHGTTLGTLALGGHKARKAIYLPMLSEHMSHVEPPYPYRGMKQGESEEAYVERLGRELDEEFQRVGADKVCAFIAETASGLTLGGVPAPKNYLATVKKVCRKHGALLILDEVLCGMGRTGHYHAWQHENVVPDLQTIAKGLGAGYQPIGALLAHRDIVNVMTQGTGSFVHNVTYQGHPVACAGALAVQHEIDEQKMVENVRRLGPELERLLRERLGSHPNVGDIRGRGFMWAMELVQDKKSKKPFPASKKLAATMHATGLKEEFGISVLPGGGVADGVDGDVVMLTPALNLTREEVRLMVERTARVIEHVLGGGESKARL